VHIKYKKIVKILKIY